MKTRTAQLGVAGIAALGMAGLADASSVRCSDRGPTVVSIQFVSDPAPMVFSWQFAFGSRGGLLIIGVISNGSFGGVFSNLMCGEAANVNFPIEGIGFVSPGFGDPLGGLGLTPPGGPTAISPRGDDRFETVPVSSIPLPTTGGLALAGLLGAAGLRGRRRG